MADEQRKRQAGSFGAGAAAYERARPSYPAAAVDWLIPDTARRVLDLGAGTGKLTRLLAGRGLDVVAVDPSAGMLVELRRVLPDVEVHEGSAEAIPLPDGSIDAALAGQAWHWFDPLPTAAEIARVLRPGGTLAIVWNTRDTDVESVERFNQIVDRSGPSYSYGPAPTLPVPFGPVESTQVRWTYRLTEPAFLDLAASRSGFLVMSEAEQHALLEEVRALFDEVASASHGDPDRREVAVPYVTRCFRAVRG